MVRGVPRRRRGACQPHMQPAAPSSTAGAWGRGEPQLPCSAGHSRTHACTRTRAGPAHPSRGPFAHAPLALAALQGVPDVGGLPQARHVPAAAHVCVRCVSGYLRVCVRALCEQGRVLVRPLVLTCRSGSGGPSCVPCSIDIQVLAPSLEPALLTTCSSPLQPAASISCAIQLSAC